LSQQSYDIAIIGSGILGASISYFLASSSKSKIVLIEQESMPAAHTSSRNTGKVHAPFLYDPAKKKHFAKAAYLGFEMLRTYCNLKSLPFKQDGVLEVATYDKGIDRLHKYMSWGFANGLTKNELKFLDKNEVAKMEPNVECLGAIHCSRDGSVNYGAITQNLVKDLRQFGATVLLGNKVRKVEVNSHAHEAKISIQTTSSQTIHSDFMINAAGGNSIDIAHSLGVARNYTDLHFRGEYWRAPAEYDNLTQISVYSVPKYPEYPFLDPHWIVRADGRREIGPNAVLVFGPYAYSWSSNLRYFLPKVAESLGTGAQKMLSDRQFLSLVFREIKSSLSKTAMINRAREFLPGLNPAKFVERGTAGIRSSLIDRGGKFVPDTLVITNDSQLHILNYNSPGATGALPTGAMIANQLIEMGVAKSNTHNEHKTPWDVMKVADEMRVQ
jgi:L-2-hydroxyglutarate oxidase